MSARDWLSPIQLLDSTVLGVQLYINHSFDGENPSGAKFTLNTRFDDIEANDEMWLCRGMIEAIHTASEDGDESKVLFLVSCSMGVLVGLDKNTVSTGLAASDLKEVMEMNALSLGYGKLRYFVEDLTSQSAIGRLTLPAVNANEYMKIIAGS